MWWANPGWWGSPPQAALAKGGGGGGTNLFTLISSGTNGSTASPQVVLNTTGANLLVAIQSQYGGTTISSVTDVVGSSNSNTWTPLTAQNSASDSYVRIWYTVPTFVGAGHTFNLFGSGIFGDISVQAWSGASATPFDVENGAVGSGVATLSTGSVTPSNGGSLIVAGLTLDGGGTAIGIGGGFTTTAATDWTAGLYLGTGMAYLKQTSIAAVNPAWNWTSNSNCAAAIAVFHS